ncbi:MAG: NAD(+)/NADH kinase [Verrucomicrobia bacterium]|nr:NAD(+)/NADH kinase [Verrucomicrobiota bacterium]
MSRGGEKLEGFLREYPLPLAGIRVLDVGASTGGFTDCCLQSGAEHVTCVDVGYGQLHAKLRDDPRVTNLEKVNARHLQEVELPFECYDLVVMDLSFISLRIILPAVWPRVAVGGQLIALIKPQFEAGKKEVDQGRGVIRDPLIHQRVLAEIREFVRVELTGSEEVGVVESPIRGADGNVEFLLGLTKLVHTMKRIQKLAVVINRNKPGALELGQQLERTCGGLGVECRLSDAFPVPADFLRECGLCCVIGGDGTILGVVAEAVRHQVPVLGVNLGTLGFMANFSADDLLTGLSDILSGGFRVLPRTLLDIRCADGTQHLALNDVVIKSGGAHLAQLEVHSNGKYINTFAADGLIVATPTGSTAYNLSAGGPIIHPEAQVMVLTPINPHTLSNRSLVLDGKRSLQISPPPHQRGPLTIASDGLAMATGEGTFPLQIQLSIEKKFLLVHPREYSHFQVLRTKLQWTGGRERGAGPKDA